MLGMIDLGRLAAPEVWLLVMGALVLWGALVADARASHRTARARTARSRSFQPHARRVTRSRYMAYPTRTI